jgi:hypothetical protein
MFRLAVSRGVNERTLEGREKREREINFTVYLSVFVEKEKEMLMFNVFYLVLFLILRVL